MQIDDASKLLTADNIYYHLEDVGIILMDWFMTEPSMKDLVDGCADLLSQAGFFFTRDDLESALYEELWYQVSRHEAPFFSDGIKAELKAQGEPVTVEAVLDAAFEDEKDTLRWFIQKHGVHTASSEQMLESIWGPDKGCFYYTPEQLQASWKRLGII